MHLLTLSSAQAGMCGLVHVVLRWVDAYTCHTRYYSNSCIDAPVTYYP